MKTKPKSDSAEAAVRAMIAAAAGPILPPAHYTLRPGDQPFWDAIIRSRTHDEWTEADLAVAAQLARCHADVEREQLLLDGEQCVITNKGGRSFVNARAVLLDQYTKRGMALMRSLRLCGRIAGDARAEVNHRKLQRSAEKLRKELGDDLDHLLAT